MDGFIDRSAVLSKVETELVYIVPGSGKPRTFCYKLPPGVPHSNYTQERRRHFIHDGRPLASDLALDTQGFVLLERATEFGDFDDHDAIRRSYYPEAERILQAATGADRVFAFGHTVRRQQPDGPGRTDHDRMPVQQVHVDRTDSWGAERVRELVPDEADALLGGRMQIINLWRPIRGPLESMPLALCDARSVQPEHIVSVEMVLPDRSFEVFRLVYDAAHRWLYFPQMRTDEIVLLKCYDSLQDGRARFTPHTAFADPTTPAGAAPRESIEVQAIVLHCA
jgi:hypothetical protein